PDRRILPRILGSLTFHLSFGPVRLSCAVRREACCPVIQRHSRTATIITALPFRHVNAISHSVDLLVLIPPFWAFRQGFGYIWRHAPSSMTPAYGSTGAACRRRGVNRACLSCHGPRPDPGLRAFHAGTGGAGNPDRSASAARSVSLVSHPVSNRPIRLVVAAARSRPYRSTTPRIAGSYARRS